MTPTPSSGRVLHPDSGSYGVGVPPHWSGVMRSGRHLVLSPRLPESRLQAIALDLASRFAFELCLLTRQPSRPQKEGQSYELAP